MAFVMIEPAVAGLVCCGNAVDRLVTGPAGLIIRQARVLYIVADEEIESAIVIIVEPGARSTPHALIRHACLPGDIPESPAFVVEKVARAENACDIEVFAAIVVIIPDGNSHGIEAWDLEAGLTGDIGETTVAVVAIKC